MFLVASANDVSSRNGTTKAGYWQEEMGVSICCNRSRHIVDKAYLTNLNHSSLLVKHNMAPVPIKLSLKRPIEVPSISQQVNRPRFENVERIIDTESRTELVRNGSPIDFSLEVDDVPRVYE